MAWYSNINWGDVASAGVKTAGDIAKARAAGREAQATQQVNVDQLNQNAYRSDTDARTEGLKAQDAALLVRAAGMLEEQAAARKAAGERASNSVRGDILANVGDVKLSGLPSRIPKMEFEGGLRPSLLSGNSRTLGAEMSRQALMDQMQGDATPYADLPAADFSSVINSKTPGGTALPEGSKLDSILGAIALYGGLGSSLYEGNRKQTPTTDSPAPPTTATAPPAMVGTPVAPPGPPVAPPPKIPATNTVPGYSVRR